MADHCSELMADVPESVRQSMYTSSAFRRKALYWAPLSASMRSARVLFLMGSTTLMRKGSAFWKLGSFKKLTLCIFFILCVKNNNSKIINCQSCNYKSICVINIINNRQSGLLFHLHAGLLKTKQPSESFPVRRAVLAHIQRLIMTVCEKRKRVRATFDRPHPKLKTRHA